MTLFRSRLWIALCIAACNGNGQDNGDDNGNGDPPAPQRVLVEIDRMASLPGLSQARLDRLAAIYAPAGITLDVRQDQNDLPHAPAVRRSDLHNLMTSFRSLTPPAGAWHLHVLFVTEDFDRPTTLGVMFDSGGSDRNAIPREGCAVFLTAHPGGEAGREEALLTLAHELGHCFNLHHRDWEGADFEFGATVMSYSPAHNAIWKLSDRSTEHLIDERASHPKFVMPGAGGVPFAHVRREHDNRHQSVPVETYTVLDERVGGLTARGRPLPAGAVVGYAAPAQGERQPRSGLRLTIGTPKTDVVVFDPVRLTARLENRGRRAAAVLPSLQPDDHSLLVEIRHPGQEVWRPFRPAMWACDRGRGHRKLAVGETITSTVDIFYGTHGWSFTAPGKYAVRAQYATPGSRQRLLSNELVLTVAKTEASTRVAEIVATDDVGMYLLFGGCGHLAGAERSLKNLYAADKDLSAGQKQAFAAALGQSFLRPVLPGKPGERPRPPNLAEARKYLEVALVADGTLPEPYVEQLRTRLEYATGER